MLANSVISHENEQFELKSLLWWAHGEKTFSRSLSLIILIQCFTYIIIYYNVLKVFFNFSDFYFLYTGFLEIYIYISIKLSTHN